MFAHRLEHEFGAEVLLGGTPYTVARRTDEATASALRGRTGIRIVNRSDGSLIALFDSKYYLDRIISDNPEYALNRMVAGLV